MSPSRVIEPEKMDFDETRSHGSRSARRGAGVIAAVLLTALAACDQGKETPRKEPPMQSATPPSASPTSSASAAPSATSAANAAPKAESGFPGAWAGNYDAKKGSVSLPPKVKDKGLAADDGKKAAGPGTVELTVGEDGDVHGKIKGALGPGTITGKTEKGMLRGSITPDDPRAPDAMFGVIVGALKGDVITGEIRVAGPDATVVREGTIELKKK
ncbi:MAG: hypothetical protein QM820_52425 [Minicystis sp.]